MKKAGTAPEPTIEPAYALRVALEYTQGNSDKFYRIVALPQRGEVVVAYGRRGTEGNVCSYPCGNVGGTARKMWDLLRAKVGKGYVVTAADTVAVEGFFGTASDIMYTWGRTAPMGWRGARPLAVKSTRPAKEGAGLIAELFTAEPDVEAFFEIPFVGECEEFLKLLTYAHPGCPVEVLVMKDLLGA